MCGKQTDMNHNTAIHRHLYKPWKREKRVRYSIFTSNNINCTNNPWKWQISISDNSHSIWAHTDKILVTSKCDVNNKEMQRTYQPFPHFLISTVIPTKQMQLADRFTYVWESKWPPLFMTDLPTGTTSLHGTSVSSSHIGYYHQLAQVCHPFNIFSGELGLDHWHNSCCDAAYTSLSTVPVNYLVVVPNTSAMATLSHTVGYISWTCQSIPLPMNCFCSLDAYGIQLASWLDLGSRDQRNNQSNCTLAHLLHLLQWSHLTFHSNNAHLFSQPMAHTFRW